MDRNTILITCALVCTLMMASVVQANSNQSDFPNKLNQGLANIVFGIIEIPKNVINITNHQNIFVGVTVGTIRGIVHSVSRVAVGSIQLLTSPIPTSEFAAPAYVWERFSEDSRYFGLHYPAYWTVYGPLDDGK